MSFILTVDISSSPSVAFTNVTSARSGESTSRSTYTSTPSPLYTKMSVSSKDCILDMLGSQSWASTPGGRNCLTSAAEPATFLVNS